ncbi:MAG: PIN domain-containing protein [Myxococcales bacterium]|nr:PIN domain-containing protein [Myxococcales bacterium]
MKVAFDTSVLVAASIVGHPHEARALAWVQAARRGEIEGAVSTHALAETWATLTALPVEPRVAPTAAARVVERLEEHLEVLEISTAVYREAIRRCADRGHRSGALYDALHLVTAEHWRADVMLTFNTAHFTRLAREEGPRVLAPPDPPSVLR